MAAVALVLQVEERPLAKRTNLRLPGDARLPSSDLQANCMPLFSRDASSRHGRSLARPILCWLGRWQGAPRVR